MAWNIQKLLMEHKDLKRALSERIGELASSPFPQENADEHWSMELDRTEKSNSK